MTTTRAGMRLGGRYRLTERLAFGGMGEVWAGVDEVLGRAVAVKILRPELARDDAFRRRFREEARTAGGLSHPGIAAVYDYGEGTPSEPATPHAPDSDLLGLGPHYSSNSGYDQHEPDWTTGDDVAYLVMELVPGQPLSAILSESGPLPPVRALELVAQSARGLHAAHQRGVVHRDVKPANLMVTPQGRVKVTDFGIARPQDHEPLTATGQVMGTAHYLAPELARGHTATPSSDVYALGVVAYECVAGRRPFEGDNQVAVATAHLSEEPPALPPELPADVRRVITTAMQKEPEYRFVSADAFAEVLDFVRFRLLAGDPMPVWANRGPVPGVGAMRVPGSPRTPGSAGPGGAAGYLTGAGTGTGGGAGRDDGFPGPTDYLSGGTGTAALPLGRRAARQGLDASGRPRTRTSLTPILVGIGLVVLVGALIVGFTMINRPGNENGSGTTPSSTSVTSSAPAVSVPSPDWTTSSRPIFTSRHATGSVPGTRTSTATSTATGTKTATTSPTPTPTPTTTPPPTSPTSSATPAP